VDRCRPCVGRARIWSRSLYRSRSPNRTSARDLEGAVLWCLPGSSSGLFDPRASRRPGSISPSSAPCGGGNRSVVDAGGRPGSVRIPGSRSPRANRPDAGRMPRFRSDGDPAVLCSHELLDVTRTHVRRGSSPPWADGLPGGSARTARVRVAAAPRAAADTAKDHEASPDPWTGVPRSANVQFVLLRGMDEPQSDRSLA